MVSSFRMRPALYIFINVVIGCSIVFVNKAVFQNYGFHFVITLTCVHSIVTALGLTLMGFLGVFQQKQIPQLELFPLTLSFVAYIVCTNLSLELNTVGFYQIMKIATTPVLIMLEMIFLSKFPRARVLLSVALVCLGVVFSTVTDELIVHNSLGIFVAFAATIATASYLILAGSKQKQLQASSPQLLAASSPQAIVLLLCMIPVFDSVGFHDPSPGTLIGYPYTLGSLLAILLSSVLAVLVNLTTFLVIGATSSLTYIVVGQVKNVIILAGGCIIFGDLMTWKKALGVSITMIGIVWYSMLITAPPEPPLPDPTLPDPMWAEPSKDTKSASPLSESLPLNSERVWLLKYKQEAEQST